MHVQASCLPEWYPAIYELGKYSLVEELSGEWISCSLFSSGVLAKELDDLITKYFEHFVYFVLLVIR